MVIIYKICNDLTMYINYYKGGSIINKVAGKDTSMVYNKFLNLLELLKFII